MLPHAQGPASAFVTGWLAGGEAPAGGDGARSFSLEGWKQCEVVVQHRRPTSCPVRLSCGMSGLRVVASSLVLGVVVLVVMVVLVRAVSQGAVMVGMPAVLYHCT